MKKQILKIGTLILITAVSLTFTSCADSNSEKGHQNTEENQTNYQCPMECEGDKTYSEEGSCPVCGMDLKEV